MTLIGTSGMPPRREEGVAGLGISATGLEGGPWPVDSAPTSGRRLRLVGSEVEVEAEVDAHADGTSAADPAADARGKVWESESASQLADTVGERVSKPMAGRNGEPPSTDDHPDADTPILRIEPASPADAPPARASDRKVEWVRDAVGRYERPLTQYALHVLGGDLERARDLVQETFLRLCDQDEQALQSHLAEWLYTVCRNLAIDQKRKDRRMRLMTDEQEATFAAAQENPTDAAERVDSYQKVVDAIATLPPRQQEIVRLKFQHGLSYKQIGEVMNLTATNVGFILHTAMKTLRGQFGAESADEPPEPAE